MQEERLNISRRSRRMQINAGGDMDDRGWTLLHIVAQKGDLKEVKRLLNEGMDANVTAGSPKSLGVTPLHLAAKGGHLRVMDALLERGADIDARTKCACGWTPLHHAAKESKRKAIRFLIRNDAFLPDDIHDTRFNPPLHYCPGLEWAYEELRLLPLERVHHQARPLTARETEVQQDFSLHVFHEEEMLTSITTLWISPFIDNFITSRIVVSELHSCSWIFGALNIWLLSL
ncbi:hypothetical protein RND71_027014 [Anisodus tanguticus]|uniref:Uncharacterized protein n=1 Tax=Anisodus tanguticus TaxID=243964 RepID=A0AAE1VBT9_9SOLA|nr:hypothetical protein RND71_027014 [Anisodus tanguticus]